jgi:hypothetical protein
MPLFYHSAGRNRMACWGDGWSIAQAMREAGFDCVKIKDLVCRGVLSRVEHGCAKLAGGKQSLAPVVASRRRNGRVSDWNVPEIIEDMSRGDIVETLQHLRLPHEESSCVLRLDRGCRDFLVMTLRGR